jgi:PAS domain S-box-containing protein
VPGNAAVGQRRNRGQAPKHELARDHNREVQSAPDNNAPAPRPGDSLQAHFQLLVEAVIDYGIFSLDTRGNVASWNTGAQNILGYSADEIIGRHFSTFYPPDAIARGWPEEELRRAVEHRRLEDEGWRVRKDGSRFWANVTITPMYDPNGRLTGSYA